MRCTIEDYGKILLSEVKSKKDPFYTNPDDKGWDDIFHTEKGGIAAVAASVAKADGAHVPEMWRGTANEHNPLIGRLTKSAPELVKQGLYTVITPEKSVAPKVLDEIRTRLDTYDKHITADQTRSDQRKVYQAHVSNSATDLLNDIEERPGDYGITDGNQYATRHFLEQVENGWPRFDYQGERQNPKLELGYVANKMSENAMKSRVTLNPMVYTYHAGELPIRTFSEYPLAGAKATLTQLGKDWRAFNLLNPARIPEADAAGVYTKSLPEDRKTWTLDDYSRAATGIPQCQTVSENLAWALHAHAGVDLDEAMANVALTHQDPFKTLPMFTIPDNHGAGSYIRYSALQNSWYLNLYKRVLDGRLQTADSWRALRAIGLYTTMKSIMYGTKAAVPFGGFIAGMSPQVNQAFNDFDKESGLNLTKQATGIDMGGSMSPLNPWGFYFYRYKMLYDAGDENARDIQKIAKDWGNQDYAGAGLHATHTLMLDASIMGAPVPYSVTKGVGATLKQWMKPVATR